MATLLNDPVAPPSQSIMHAVARHRDALQDYSRDFQRAKVSGLSLRARWNADVNVFTAGERAVRIGQGEPSWERSE